MPQGPVTYVLTRKQIKNLNLHIERDGSIQVSIPLRCPSERADDLVREKWSWIAGKLAQREEQQADPLPPVSPKACAALLAGALERVYPLTAPLGVRLPALKLRAMKSQWGNCHWAQGYITLNTALARCPQELRDYVALHELVHFLYHDHGPEFHSTMDALMPDWRERRKELKRYGALLDHPGDAEG